ncbi:sensor domain-containing protein [Catenulispora pinisilvae]|uniref:sensor domain-containing protein n=1 Tax=Catenulispora pinisilvae TaxID=2705253 RepID=UPI0018923727|nr:sensor domain-containing protein [Catenulispora pinisilvae]
MAGEPEGRNEEHIHTGDQDKLLGDDTSALTTQQLNVVTPAGSSLRPASAEQSPANQPIPNQPIPNQTQAYPVSPLAPAPAPAPTASSTGGGYQTLPPQQSSFSPSYGPVPQPPLQPTKSFQAPKLPTSPRDRRRLLIIGLVAVVVLGGGLTFAVWPSGAKKAPVAVNPQHVVAGTVQAGILTPDDVSKAVGTTVISGSAASQPPPALTAAPTSCAVAIGPATAAGYTEGWTVFYSTTYQDSTGAGDYTVTQTIGKYGDANQSGAVFQGLAKGVAGCPSATRTDQKKNTVKWNYTVDTNTSEDLAWTASQDSGGGWACYRQARLKGKAVLQVAVCEGGDGKAAAAQVADQFAAKVSG